MSDPIDRQAAIDALDSGAELLRRVLDITDIVGAEREKYKWGLELIESYISDMKALSSAEPDEDVVSKGLFEQIKWERDVAIDQLEALGYSLGEKPKKGKWISERQKNKGLNFWMYCSLCGYKTIDAPSSRTNYCPNCGARMED